MGSEAVLVTVCLVTDRTHCLGRHTGLVVIARYVDIE